MEDFFLLWRCDSTRVIASSFLRFLDHKQRRTTVGRTPLDEWSDRRRDLYLTTHNTHNRQTSMTPVGFEPTISAGERPQTYALDRAATGTGYGRPILFKFICYIFQRVTILPFLTLTGPRIKKKRKEQGRPQYNLWRHRSRLVEESHNHKDKQWWSNKWLKCTNKCTALWIFTLMRGEFLCQCFKWKTACDKCYWTCNCDR